MGGFLHWEMEWLLFKHLMIEHADAWGHGPCEVPCASPPPIGHSRFLWLGAGRARSGQASTYSGQESAYSGRAGYSPFFFRVA